MAQAIAISRIEVREDRINLLARFADGAPRVTSPGLIERALERYPDLAVHSCVNEVGKRFGDVMERTPLPHLLEHMILSEMTRDPRTPAAFVVKATSQWIDEARGIARIEVSYADDLAALASIRTALEVLNALLAQGREKPLPPSGRHC